MEPSLALWFVGRYLLRSCSSSLRDFFRALDFRGALDWICQLFALLASSALTLVCSLAMSTLYRSAARARLESFASDCLGL